MTQDCHQLLEANQRLSLNSSSSPHSTDVNKGLSTLDFYFVYLFCLLIKVKFVARCKFRKKLNLP